SKNGTLPPALKPGHHVALVAPAGPLLERDDLSRGQELCRALGFEPVLGANAGRRYGYLAGTDEERLADLNAALADPGIDAVWCLRGGYGLTRILDRVDFGALRQRPKAVIGFSDVTALLLALHRESGVVTFHGPMARSPLTPFSRYHFDRVLTAVNPPGRLGRIAPPADVLVPKQGRIVGLVPGTAEGRLFGGNLTLLQCLIGTRYFPDLDGAILFLEDVDEDLYAIDRMLAHLRMTGALRKLAGVIIGQFTEMKRSTEDGALGFDEVLGTYLAPLRIPVAYGLPIGHVDDQWTLPIGIRARLDAGAGEVELLEPSVR
ncbi:MAG TPA: LD-carboxypeptidase, partial [Gemmatimonadales bacterium]|nr:LD-carboxypeptidase [Gemmatimonadales bacterium]